LLDALKDFLAGNGARGVTELRFELGYILPWWLFLIALAALGVWSVRWHRARMTAAPPRYRAWLVGLRTAAILIVAFLALYPRFVGLRFDPNRNYLLMLFDDSISMTIPDVEGTPRGERVLDALEANKVEVENLLEQRYRLARYGYGDSARRMRQIDELSFTRPESDLAGSIEDALRDFQGINVSALVVFSDGVDQPASNRLPETDGVPVITVGTGGSTNWRDLEMRDVAWTRSFGDERPVTVTLTFAGVGLAGRTVVAEVVDGLRVAAKRTLQLETDDEVHEIKLEVVPEREGWISYTARIRLQELFAVSDSGEGVSPADEDITRNNQLRFLVDNRPLSHELLYFSGRPNWENKFVQSALERDEEIALTSVLRISAAEKKFVYRGKKSSLVNPLFEGFYDDVEDQPRYDEAVFLRFGGAPEDAGKGFPEDKADLFAYDLLVLGDIEARFFSRDQLALIKDFIQQRGGTLLCLGGPHAFSEGKYDDTVLAGLLPVVLSKQRRSLRDIEALSQEFAARPTIEGLLDGTWALDPNPDKNKALWESLPPLTGLNTFPMLRPGATVLAGAESDASELDGVPLFALQRYGMGKTAIMATGSTWQWHMGTEPGDGRHGRFWRQLVRALTMDTPDPVELRGKQDSYVMGKRVPLSFLVRDELFEARTGARVTLTLTDPTGKIHTPGVEESLQETGTYTAELNPNMAGRWRLELEARDPNGEVIGSLEEALLVEEDRRELQSARYDPARLERIAEATGGRFFELDEVAQIPDRIPFVQHQDAEVVTVPFWHFPGFLLALSVIMTVDWYLRRKRGFA